MRESGGPSRLRVNKSAALESARGVPVWNIACIAENERRRIAAESVTIRRLGGRSHYSPVNLEISRLDARTDITSLDGRHLCVEAETDGAEALPVRADAGAAVSLQSGVRGLREDSVSTTHSEEGIDPRGVF